MGLWRWHDPAVYMDLIYVFAICFLIFFLMSLIHPYPVMECSKDQKYSMMKNKQTNKQKKKEPNGVQ